MVLKFPQISKDNYTTECCWNRQPWSPTITVFSMTGTTFRCNRFISFLVENNLVKEHKDQYLSPNGAGHTYYARIQHTKVSNSFQLHFRISIKAYPQWQPQTRHTNLNSTIASVQICYKLMYSLLNAKRRRPRPLITLNSGASHILK